MSDVHAVPGSSTRLDRVLNDLLRRCPELQAAAVVSFDGLPMASALPHGFDEDRVAAMSAALLSLGERASQGLGRGSLNQVYVEGEEGTVFLVSADDEAVLVAVGSHGAKVGLLLFEVRRGALAVAETLRHEDLPEPAHGYVSREVVAPMPVHVAGHEPEPAHETAAVATPVVEAPVVEAPVVEAPAVESPAEEPVFVAAPAVESPVEPTFASAPAQPVEPVFVAAPVVEEPVAEAEAVPVVPSYGPPVHTPSYSNLHETPTYPTYNGQPADDADVDDDDPLPVGEVPPVGTYQDQPAAQPVPAPSGELGSWATFTPGGSLSAPSSQGLDPWS
ncbi:MAG TPA: roadblock/LC7 domain-containing protein [Actinomycetes bacterium]|nr:roadblock/LC7 domain-containing protein [Actinomycetes bacterium]